MLLRIQSMFSEENNEKNGNKVYFFSIFLLYFYMHSISTNRSYVFLCMSKPQINKLTLIMYGKETLKNDFFIS